MSSKQGTESSQILTYFSKGSKVNDQMIADIMPMTSSLMGAPFSEGKMVERTYSGEVPMSL
jgi:hypothetical protein